MTLAAVALTGIAAPSFALAAVAYVLMYALSTRQSAGQATSRTGQSCRPSGPRSCPCSR